MKIYKLTSNSFYNLNGGEIKKLISLNNPQWPPELGKTIIAKTKTYKEFFIGKVIEYIWNKTGVVVLLMNNIDYVEDILRVNDIIPGTHGGKGLFVLVSSYGWQYLTDTELANVIKVNNNEHNITDKMQSSNIIPDVISTEYTKNTTKFVLNSKLKNLLQQKLEAFEPIKEQELIVLIDENDALKIYTETDELRAGNRIINWINTNFINKMIYNDVSIFSDFRTSIVKGYVHINRTSISTENLITKTLINDLNILKWQYNKPINHKRLQDILKQNKPAESLKYHMTEKKEALEILSQEYLIALNPVPKYCMWCVKRLFTCWYVDDVLNKNIRKIKILINQWKCNSSAVKAKCEIIYPSIVVYPKYGYESSQLVLKKLSYYFSSYNDIARNSYTPMYFVNYNPLIYYTSGSITMKMYFKEKDKKEKDVLGNNVLTKYKQMLNLP